jgi:DME family drug/metabolite transporter
MRWNLALAGLAASWGLIAVIVAGVDLDATVLVFFRLALASLTMIAVALALQRPELLRPGGGHVTLVVLGLTLAGHWFLYFETIKLSSVAVAVVTVYTAPIYLALAAPVFLPERRSLVGLAALVPASAGIVLVALGGGGEGGAVRPLAIVTGLAAGASYAALVIVTKRVRTGLPPVTIHVWTTTIAALALAPFLVTASRIVPDDALEWASVLLLGVVFTGLSGFLYITLLGHVSAQAAGVLAFLEPVSAAFLAWAILDEPHGLAVLVGGVLVLASGVAVVLREPPDATAIETLPVTEAVPEAEARLGSRTR